MKKIQAQDRLSGEKFKFLYTSKHSGLVKLGAVWLNVKTYQTVCPVKNKNFRIDCPNVMMQNTEYFGLYRNSHIGCDVTPTSRMMYSQLDWVLEFYLTCNDISVIYVTAYRCALRRTEEVVPMVGLAKP